MSNATQLEVAFIGMGNVGRAFTRLLARQHERIESMYGFTVKTVGIATRSHGSVVSSTGIDLLESVDVIEGGAPLTTIAGCIDAGDAWGLLEAATPDIILETVPLNPADGEPARGYIRRALERGIHVVSANKGPVAFAYQELKGLADLHGVQYRFEGAVMDGTPVFNLVEYCLPGTKILGFAGVLNSTTNLILGGMERGRSFEDCLDEARRAGIAEENASYDIDGWDAAVKATALARVLMNAEALPSQVNRTGIAEISRADLINAAAEGNVVRLIARGRTIDSRVELTVKPEAVPISSTLGSVRGTSNALILHTDMMGEIAIVETDPGIEQTAYALLSDVIRIEESERPRRTGQSSGSGAPTR
ncbi:MAG TPA: homoserine dehydrogenase [Blastocatellia bacterium]